MKVIIDISEDLYNRIFDGEIALNTDDKWELEESVRLSIMHGKVLPKNHGRLVDADKIGLTNFECFLCNGDYKEALKMLIDKVKNTDAIVEADKEAEE